MRIDCRSFAFAPTLKRGGVHYPRFREFTVEFEPLPIGVIVAMPVIRT